MFEEISGSINLKQQCDDFKGRIYRCDEEVKRDTESLGMLRMEKVKQKGLQEFAEQMNECLKEQKDIEVQMHLAEILLCDKSINDLHKSLGDYETGLQQTEILKSNVLSDLKRYEAELRKLSNQEEDQSRLFKLKKEELLTF